MKNVKTTYVNLYYNLSLRFLKTYFSTGGACAPPGPPVESPMTTSVWKITKWYKHMIWILDFHDDQYMYKPHIKFCVGKSLDDRATTSWAPIVILCQPSIGEFFN